jgi:16S rRNA (uracil1498-N3)-methyltransferase
VKQFILKKEPDKGIVRLEGDDYRYLVTVRRLAVGESFPALLPGGEETLIQIISIDKKVLTGKCIGEEFTRSHGDTGEIKDIKKNASSKIILFQAMPKGDKMDLIVRQAAEGGIAEIVPFVSEFSFAKTGARGQKFSRWERIIKEARQQSGSKTATSIREPLTESELFEYWDTIRQTGTLGLLFHHQGLEQESLHSYLDSTPDVVALTVGPEGGFSDREVSLFMDKGFKPFTIGDTVLRTETAALYCAAAVRILLLERNSWELK